ncbi:MAG: sugar phosphate isomerase/epimerase [Candidatus Omnitrophica bacterium]|nr:sugar phosphate isomerase/epimerase [Candidatus Omnitrophota bacterium]
MAILEKVRICAHIWAYAAREPANDVYPILERIFEDFSKTDCEGIELMGNSLLHDDSYERISELSSKYSVPVIGSSFGAEMYDKAAHKQIFKEVEQIISILSRIEARNLGISTGAKANAKKSPEELDAQAEILMKIKRIGKDNGIIMNLHNHTYEVKDDEYELKENIKRIPDVKLGPDLNWLLRAGIEPIDFLRRYKERIVYMHIRDQKGDRWTEALGDGDFNLSLFKETLEEINFRGDIAIELAHEKNHKFVRSMGENFKLSCQNLKKVLGE